MWREEKTNTLWKVDGIVAHRHKQRSKAVVLSDSPNGVEWGNANKMGSIEGGLLIWRNRRGHVTHEWERVDPQGFLTPWLKNALQPKSYEDCCFATIPLRPCPAAWPAPQASMPLAPASALPVPANLTSTSPRSTQGGE